MSDSSDVQALEKISSEVGDSQIRISLSSHCIKAQAFLFDKLRKQSERQKEICNFISSSNLKLQTEIKQAELEIKSLLTAQATIKSSNVELKKECWLVKEKRSEIEERINNGEKKYEKLWLQAKSRYESIPFVQSLLKSQMKTKNLKENIINVEKKCKNLTREIEAKKQYLIDLDRKRIIDLAEYIVHDVPSGRKTIYESTKAIIEISKEVDYLLKEQDKVLKIPITKNTPKIKENNEIYVEKSVIANSVDDGWFNIYQNIDRESIKIPNIQFVKSDFEVLGAKWDKIKNKKDEMLNITPSKRNISLEGESEICNKKFKTDENYSVFLNKPITDGIDNFDKKKDNYSNRKLINILEDIKLDQKHAYNIMSRINLNKLKGIDKIGHDVSKDDTQSFDLDKEQGSEEIKEIDLTKNFESILVPPTQFLDNGEDNVLTCGSQHQVEVIVHMAMSDSFSGKGNHISKNSQENGDKKKVSFDLPLSIQEIKNDVYLDVKIPEENIVNETIDSQVDISLTGDESYTKIKDMILKKHQLDLSPQFIYAKAKTNSLQTNNNERLITSKFFQVDKEDINEIGENVAKVTEIENEPIKNHHNPQNDNLNMEDVVIVSSPKKVPVQNSDRSVTGFLFNHGTQGIPDSLNVSISTTGFDDGDAEFPHCIDSSLLLSPKADLPLPMSGNNAEITSQEVPNFLSGLRKTGFLFFGQPAATDSKPDLNENQTNNFNFNFGRDEKKGRGGLFNMFR